MNKEVKSKLWPISLAILVIILDQITKILVMKNIPLYTIGASFFGDFLRIIHVANTGVPSDIVPGEDGETTASAENGGQEDMQFLTYIFAIETL